MDIIWSVGLAAVLAWTTLGGGLYEVIVVDPAWPARMDLIQPDKGGISRKRFWIPAHTAFELSLLAALYFAWSQTAVRHWLFVALAAHVLMRVWSALQFIPQALAFERAEQQPETQAAARRWVAFSRLRLPLDFVTCLSMLAALLAAARLG